MKKFKIIVIALSFTGIMFSSCNHHIAQAKKEEKQTYYTCPMHKNVFEMRPGKCPKCGMALEVLDLDNMHRNNSGSSNRGNAGSGGHGGHNH